LTRSLGSAWSTFFSWLFRRWLGLVPLPHQSRSFIFYKGLAATFFFCSRHLQFPFLFGWDHLSDGILGVPILTPCFLNFPPFVKIDPGLMRTCYALPCGTFDSFFRSACLSTSCIPLIPKNAPPQCHVCPQVKGSKFFRLFSAFFSPFRFFFGGKPSALLFQFSSP